MKIIYHTPITARQKSEVSGIEGKFIAECHALYHDSIAYIKELADTEDEAIKKVVDRLIEPDVIELECVDKFTLDFSLRMKKTIRLNENDERLFNLGLGFLLGNKKLNAQNVLAVLNIINTKGDNATLADISKAIQRNETITHESSIQDSLSKTHRNLTPNIPDDTITS